MAQNPLQIDNLTPDYPCPNADSIRDAYQSVPAWTDHLEENMDLQIKLGEMLGTLDDSAWNTWCKIVFAHSCAFCTAG